MREGEREKSERVSEREREKERGGGEGGRVCVRERESLTAPPLRPKPVSAYPKGKNKSGADLSSDMLA
jgi:hypothetical protein